MDGLDNLKSNFKKFDGTDFGLWKDKVQAALKASKCVEAIKTEFKIKVEDEDQNKAEKERKNEETDDKAKFILMSTIADNILRKISRKSAKDIWKSLTDKYEDSNLQNVIFLRRRFLNSKQETNESVEDFIDKVEMLREELETVHTVEVTDEDTAMTILSGLLPAYENFVQCLTINIKTAKLEDVKSSLINEEKRRQEKKIDKKTIQVKMNKLFILKLKREKENGIQVINNVITVRNLAIMQKTVKQLYSAIIVIIMVIMLEIVDQRNEINRILITRRIIVIKQILMLKKKKLLHLLQMKIT